MMKMWPMVLLKTFFQLDLGIDKAVPTKQQKRDELTKKMVGVCLE